MKLPVSTIKKTIPRLAITIGDPGGIGPEVVLSALADPKVTENCDLTIIGSRLILKETYQQLSLEKFVCWENLKILDVEFDGKLEDISLGK
ncbi:MAG: 4-hydroxythreonine-4-phosphate dehydrogenase, partial [Trichodesmium sp. MAG_R04]|nr:4-hydroxythreonine-4-phosphate dehydrogenase [Trichodesmium sp. MAG_R04]